jgi:hypothetical protein
MATDIIDNTPNEHLNETPQITSVEPIDTPKIDQTPDEQINTTTESKEENSKPIPIAPNPMPSNIIINIPEQKESKSQIRANYISIIGTVLNFILIIIALVSFWQTKKAVDISEQSLKDARFKDSISPPPWVAIAFCPIHWDTFNFYLPTGRLGM